MTDEAVPNDQAAPISVPKIAGMSVLKGLVLYVAILTFAALYIDFIVRISTAPAGAKPALDAVLVSAAAALAGVLGSAFALEIGTTTPGDATNQGLAKMLSAKPGQQPKLPARAWQALSFDASSSSAASVPKTVGIWVYAFVGSAMAITYVFNQSETPEAVKALAVAFGGYVLALITAAYHNAN